MIRNLSKIWVAASVFVLLAGTAAAEDARGPYVMVRAPQSAPHVIARLWTPFAEAVSKAVGVEIRMKIYNRRQQFERDLLNGVPDFAMTNPYYFLLARDRQGYLPLVRSSTWSLSGIVVVRRDSPIRAIEELEGQELVFPSPNALGASVYPRAILTERFGLRFTPRYVGTHDNVYRNVVAGQYVAGAGIWRTLQREPEALRSQLRVLYETPPISPHPLFVHPRVPAAVRDAVARAVLQFAESDEGRQQLVNVMLDGPIPVHYERDYADLRALGLERYMGSIVGSEGN